MRIPMKSDYRLSSYYRHLSKKVLASRVLDDMSDLSEWSVESHQALINGAPMDSRGIDSGVLTSAERDGVKVGRLTCAVDTTEKNKDYGRGWGLATLFRNMHGENLEAYNRIVFDVFPDMPGFRIATLCIYLYNEGRITEPNDIAREGLHFVCMEPNKWTTVEWEFPELARDKVKGFSIQYRMQGSEPGAVNTVSFDVKNVRIERVHADKQKGWEPEEGEIVFSHAGYMPSLPKTAIGKGIRGGEFQVIRADDGLVVYEGKIRSVSKNTGKYQIFDFSDLAEEGRFFLKAGAVITRPFSISRSVWKSSVEKTLNFFYGERCGFPVPGIHDVCHADLQCRHGSVTKVMNGGWHDAGDLSQGLGNTASAVYAMLKLSEKLKDTDPALYDTCLEEARWGGEWVLKTRFSDGYRASWLTMDFWTKGFLGDYDDIIHEAARRSGVNMHAAATEALAARIFREIDPAFAYANLTAAEEDYAWAVEDEEKEKDHPMRRFFGELGSAAQGCITSLELYRTTGRKEYLDRAEAYADLIPLCQETEYPAWEKPIRGFFYTGRDHRQFVHSAHGSSEHAPLVALAMMQEVRPKAAYRNCLKLYAEYVKTAVRFTAPYEMLPASIYDLDAVDSEKPFTFFGCPTADDAKEQIRNGVRLDETHYLRLFPVWYSFRGNSGVTLTLARAALACANALKDKRLFEIVTHALEWHVGRNPFNQSLIWGEGYNYTPQYSAMSGDIVGSFPVGVETQYNEDVPYYPHANCYNYKEVWVFPAMRWLDILSAYDTDL
ncbi:MAG: glycoside hydrolase family 9 protein [Clostridia bacterium]|nr:glycoside hydrolase family 9 protein [Clostridia bacterium]